MRVSMRSLPRFFLEILSSDSLDRNTDQRPEMKEARVIRGLQLKL